MTWLLLILTLPTENATARMRIWRGLKTIGCAMLRDGVWLLPHKDQAHAHFNSIAEDARHAGGEAWVLTLQADAQQAEGFPTLFDRSAEYQAWLEDLSHFDPLANDLVATRKQLKSLNKRFSALLEIDYFPQALQTLARERLQLTEAAFQGRLVKAEPSFQQGEPVRLNKADFQGKLWATRRDLWADRLASAWLIQHFIDPEARFLWLDDTSDYPAEVVGFDFDGARFTHLGRYVTFETLLNSFNLEQDRGLQQMGQLIHTLDVGGTNPEAAGFALVLKGLKRRIVTDDELLVVGGQLLNDLYCAFSTQE